MVFPDELKFEVDMAQAVNITPQHIHDPSVHDEVFNEQFLPQAFILRVGKNARAFKRLYVKLSYVNAFEYSPDCERCKHAMK